MPSIATDLLSARVPFEYKNHLAWDAKQRGMTINGLVNEIIAGYCAKGRIGLTETEDTEHTLDDKPTDLYGIALTLIDDLVEEGYPSNEIRSAFKSLREEML